MILLIFYPISVRYVWKLDSRAHILSAFGLALKLGVTEVLISLFLEGFFLEDKSMSLLKFFVVV
jgi:hypothetical protein